MPPSTRSQYLKASGTRSTRRRSKANDRARAPSAQKGLLARTTGSSKCDISDCTAASSSRDLPASTLQKKQQLQSRPKHEEDSQNQAGKQKQKSPRRTSAKLATHEASSSIIASA